MKKRLVSLATVSALVTTLLAVASPAPATVHEITGMLCSLNGVGGNGIFNPPGVTGENGASSQGEANLAKPLFASGFATFDPTFDGTDVTIDPANDGGANDAIIDGPAAPLVSFDENHPASKISLTGTIFFDDGIYITDFNFDKGNWQHCDPFG